jgi:hypothetical protein
MKKMRTVKSQALRGLCFLLVGIGLMVGSPAQAALVAYDQFVGYNNGVLTGQGKGFGWDNNWSGGLADTSTGLSYGSLPTAGGKALTANSTSQYSGFNRNLASGLTNGTYYAGWLAQKGTSNPDQLWLSLDTSNVLDRIGAGIWPSSSTTWRLIRRDSSSWGDLDTQVNISNDTTFFVMKLDLQAGGADTARVFINPTSAGDLTNGNADQTYTFGGTGIANPLVRVAFSRRTPNPGTATDQVAFDEFRLGTEAEDMFSEITVIPEPVSLLTGLAGLTLIAVRRRR